MFHGLFAIPIAYAFGTEGVVVFFLLNEGKEIMEKWALGIKPDYLDHFGDFAVPFTVAVTLSSYLGW